MTRFMTTEEDVPLSKQSPVLVETYFFYDRWFTWVIAWDVSNGTPCTLQLQQCDSLVIYTRINYLRVTCHWWLDLKSKLKTNVPFLFRHGMYNETKLGNTKFCHVKNQSSARSWGDKQTNRNHQSDLLRKDLAPCREMFRKRTLFDSKKNVLSAEGNWRWKWKLLNEEYNYELY